MNTNIKYIGIDVHQATSVFAVLNHQGKAVAEAVIETKPEAIIDFLGSQRGTIWVTFEEGTYANWLYDVIKPHVAKLLVCDPRKNKLNGNKTDKIDARRLAELLRNNSLRAVYHGENSTRTLKELARSYISLQQDSTRIKNRIKAIFRSRGIPCRGRLVYGAKNRKEWLKKLENEGARHRADRLLRELEPLGQLRLEAQKEMVQESHKHKICKILRGIPGLGNIRVALILAYVMTPHRFRSKRKFWTYTGFSVVRRGSSEYQVIDGHVKRSKRKPLPRGLNQNYNHILKDVFKGAATTASYRGPFKKEFDARIARGTEQKLALLTLARTIASITLALWKKGERFDIRKHRLSEQTV
jgi:transposase